MASKLLTEFNALVQQAEDRHRSLLPSLTDRELDVLKLVAKGLSNREIAEELYISENTVKNHVRNILEKLQLHSRMEAVVYAMREKLLDVDDASQARALRRRSAKPSPPRWTSSPTSAAGGAAPRAHRTRRGARASTR